MIHSPCSQLLHSLPRQRSLYPRGARRRWPFPADGSEWLEPLRPDRPHTAATPPRDVLPSPDGNADEQLGSNIIHADATSPSTPKDAQPNATGTSLNL
jgi:hypothetical protein